MVQRAESRVKMCCFLALYAVARRASSEEQRCDWIAGAACVIGMGTKEVMVTAPLLTLMYDRAYFATSFEHVLRTRSRMYALMFGSWCLLAVSLGTRSMSAGFASGTSS